MINKRLSTNHQSMNVSPGKILNGRYQLISQLGQGGFGKTFLAEDQHLPGFPKCVVKQFKPQGNEPDTLQTARRLFNTEAQILYQLGTHPKIPQLFAYFEENQEFYLVQEYIDGHNLAQELPPILVAKSENEVVLLLQEILEILSFVHQQKVIHRDVNPYNIIRRKVDNKLFLIDFGAVKQITTQITQPGQTSYTVAIGTPGYLPSEQAVGHPKFSSDVYAVGVLGIQALTGCLPNQLPTNSETGEISWHHLVRISSGFRNVLDRMVRYDFRQRYPSAIEALQAIKNLTPATGKTVVLATSNRLVSSRIQPKQSSSWLSKTFIILGAIGLGAAAFFTYNHWLTANNAIDLYNQGNTLYELKRYKDALQSYEKALKIRPEYGEAWKGKGETLQALNQYPKALDAYEQAIQIQPNDWQAWIGRGQVLEKLGKNSEAIAAFNSAIQIKGNAWEAWQSLANVQLKLQQYSEAVNAFDQLLKWQSGDPSAWYQKGWALQNLQQYEEAIKSYDQAVELKPNLSQAWYQRGNALIILQKYQEAAESYEKAVQFQPNLFQAWYSQGIALSKLNRNEEAILAYEKATKVNYNSSEAWYQKGWVLHQLKRYEEAVNAYNQAAKLQPSNAQAWYNKGNALYSLGNYQQAIIAYKQAVATQKDFYQAWYSLGNSLFNLKQYEDAIAAYNQALYYKSNYQQAQKGKADAQRLLKIQQDLNQDEELKIKTEDENNDNEKNNEDNNLFNFRF